MLTQQEAQTIVDAIIDEQYDLIGPLAITQASKVNGISIEENGKVKVTSDVADAGIIIELLVRQFELMFGQTSVDVCKDAVRQIASTISRKDLPELLR